MSKNPDMVQLENGTYALLASYKEQQLVEYQGNPLIEALPLYSPMKKHLINLVFFRSIMKKKKLI